MKPGAFFLQFIGVTTFLLSLAVRADDVADRIRKAQTPNEVLGIGPNSSKEEIKRAHIEMARRYHVKAGTGDREATELMQKVNAAKDYLVKPPMEGSRPQGWSYGSSGRTDAGGSRGAGDGVNVWQKFYTQMEAAKTPEERNRLRKEQLQYVRTAHDFVQVVATNVNLVKPSGAKEAKDFAVKNMADFVSKNPKLSDLNQLAQVANLTEGGRTEVYRAAFQAAKTPTQFTELMRPQLNGMSNGGNGWFNDFESASRSEMYRFFLLNPTKEEISRMNGMVNVGFRRGVGDAMFFEGLEKAAHVKSGKIAESYRAGALRGSGSGILGRFVNKFLAVDPTLVTGVIRGWVEEKDALSLNTLTCPPGLLETPSLVSKSYLQLLTAIGPEDQELILENCAVKDQAAESKLRGLLGRTLTANREALNTDASLMICHPKNGITFKSRNGLLTQIDFAADGSLRQIRNEPVLGQGNVNHHMKYSFEDLKRPISYSSFDYPKNKRIDKPGVVNEGETSFFLRTACVSQICGEREFMTGTENSDDNIFSFDSKSGNEPSYRKPFGDMQTEFLEDAGAQMHRLLGLVRSQKMTGPGSQTKICEMLRSKQPVAVEATSASGSAPSKNDSRSDQGRD